MSVYDVHVCLHCIDLRFEMRELAPQSLNKITSHFIVHVRTFQIFVCYIFKNYQEKNFEMTNYTLAPTRKLD